MKTPELPMEQGHPRLATTNKITSPSKEQVREWFMQRRRTCGPLPTPQEIRAQLGWVLHTHFSADPYAPVPLLNAEARMLRISDAAFKDELLLRPA